MVYRQNRGWIGASLVLSVFVAGAVLAAVADTGPTANVTAPNQDATTCTASAQGWLTYTKTAGTGMYAGGYHYNWSGSYSAEIEVTALNYYGATLRYRRVIFADTSEGPVVIWESSGNRSGGVRS
jgi:hypothetical protein